MIFLKDHSGSTTLTVHAQPKASRTKIVGVHGDALKIAVQAPPVEGAANEAIQEYLAEFFGLPKSRVDLRSGSTGRRKVFLLNGLSLEQAAAKLKGVL